MTFCSFADCEIFVDPNVCTKRVVSQKFERMSKRPNIVQLLGNYRISRPVAKGIRGPCPQRRLSAPADFGSRTNAQWASKKQFVYRIANTAP